VALTFYITEKHLTETYPKKTTSETIDQYLVTEIFLRTRKTFTECLYCSRFLPEECRFNKVRVKIHLLTSQDQDEIIPPIGFELKENGYPTLENKDIYQICPTLISSDGQKVDGEYICGLVKEKIMQHEKSI
jgi:hypothetical protein